MAQTLPYADIEFDENRSLETIRATEDDAENGFLDNKFPHKIKEKQNIFHFVQSLKKERYHLS